MVRLVLVDDQALVRTGLARILGHEDGFEVVAECEDGDEVLAAVERTRPDVVLMDVRMRRVDGLTALARLRERGPTPPVLVLTTFDDDEVLWGAIEAGAAGLILKSAPAEDLIRATAAVAAGGAWLDPSVTPRVLASYRAERIPEARDAARLAQLTDRERQVLQHIATGATNAEIAAALHLSEATVKTHIGNLFAKLGVRDRAAAIVYAFTHGIRPPTG